MSDDYILSRKRDQFYTQENIAEECLSSLELYLNDKNVIFIEPSAGTGSFLYALKRKDYKYLAFDIEPKHTDIVLKDFLQLDISKLKIESDLKKVVIGNPPFGKNSSLAIEFFNHAALSVDVIAMILPATFEKESVIKRLNKKMHLVKSDLLTSNNFIFNGKLKSVPTIFQIWIRKTDDRLDNVKKLKSVYFDFVKKEDADFAIQRVGVAAGRVKKELTGLPKSSHYFIKAKDEIYNMFLEINWDSVKYNTAGNPSISKKELIELLEAKIK